MTTQANRPSNFGNQRSTPLPGDVDCEQLRELLPAYSIGVTDSEETRFVETMLEHCPEAAVELSDYLVMAEEFLYLVPVRGADERARPADVPMPKLLSVTAMRQRDARTNHVLPTSAAAPRRREDRSRGWSLPAFSAAAALLLILFTSSNLYWFAQMQQLYQEQRALAGQLEAVQLAMLPGAELPINAAQVQHRELVANLDTDVSPVAHATLFWDATDEVGSLYVSGLPLLTPDKTYQLWLVRDGHSLSLGKFRVDEAGAATLTFESPEPIEDFQHVGVSTEPASGSPAPTTPHLVIGNI